MANSGRTRSTGLCFLRSSGYFRTSWFDEFKKYEKLALTLNEFQVLKKESASQLVGILISCLFTKALIKIRDDFDGFLICCPESKPSLGDSATENLNKTERHVQFVDRSDI